MGSHKIFFFFIVNKLMIIHVEKKQLIFKRMSCRFIFRIKIHRYKGRDTTKASPFLK